MDPAEVNREVAALRSGLIRAMTKPDVITALPHHPTDALDLGEAAPSDLSYLMDLFEGSFHDHTDAELRILYRYGMTTALATLLKELGYPVSAMLDSRDPGSCEPVANLEELVGLPRPPLDLVRHLKATFSELVSRSSRSMPREVALAFRFLMIGVVIVRNPDEHLTTISSMSPRALAEGFRHVQGQPWVDDASRALLERATEQLSR